jgi:hypothetical protein
VSLVNFRLPRIALKIAMRILLKNPSRIVIGLLTRLAQTITRAYIIGTKANRFFNPAYIGCYIQDKIDNPYLTRTVYGGAFYCGTNVPARMGLRGAAITLLARAD